MKNLKKNTPPIIFLAFADDIENHLRGLREEESLIRTSLKPAEKEGICRVIYEASCTIEDIYNTFQENHGQIAIFHYGGHANSYQLLLETSKGEADATATEGLVEFLGRQPGLQFVFLNGCSTELQANELLEAGVPAVVGTTEETPDDLARSIATRFYKGLANDLTLKNGWEDATNFAQDKLINSDDANRKIGGRKKTQKKITSSFPWKFMVRRGMEKTEEWTLSIAANDPLFGLPPIADNFYLPEKPFRYLEWFRREHAKVFFGRGQDIKRLFNFINNKITEPVILFYGQTGVGKSSLLKAGVLPRLELISSVEYIRHHHEKDLLTLLREKLKAKPEESLLDIWKQKEEANGKPLHIIVDQLEETITRPLEHSPNELGEFLDEVRQIFFRKNEQPQGKLICSFRKEYHPEINDQMKELGIPRVDVFIKQMDKKGIIEAIEGLTQSPETISKYNLEVEDELAIIIADDLLEDRDSALAPVLQILLSKMWTEVENNEERKFTIELYQSLKKDGYLLSDFLKEKLKELETWNEESVQSGLVLDLLYFHTTSKGTANKRFSEEIEKRYQHWSTHIDDILKNIKSKYLLTDAAVNTRNEGLNSITLAHDTLAPLVREMFEESDKPGQKAARIFKNKKEEWVKSKSNALLTEDEVTALEQGKKGMKTWDESETELYETCKKQIENLKAKKKQLNQMLLGSLVAIMLLSVFGFITQRQKNKTLQSNILLEQGQSLLSSDPTQALEKFLAADAIRNDSTTTRRIIDVKRDHVFYDVLNEVKLPIARAAFSSDGKFCAFSNKENETEIILFDILNKNSKTLKGAAHAISLLEFSPDNKTLLANSLDRGIYLYQINSSSPPTQLSNSEKIDFHKLTFSDNGSSILGIHEDYVQVWDVNNLNQLNQTKSSQKITTAAFQNRNIILGKSNGELSLVNPQTNSTLTQTQASSDSSAISKVLVSNDLVVAGLDNGTIKVWKNTGSNLNLLHNLNGHTQAILDLRMSSDKRTLVSSSDDRTAIVWDLQSGRKLKTLLGHSSPIKAIQFSQNEYEIYSASENQILKWQLPNDFPIRTIESQYGINDLVIDKNEFVIAGTNRDAISGFNLKDFQINSLTNIPDAKIKSIAISADEKFIAAGSNNGEVVLYQFDGKTLLEKEKIKVSDREVRQIELAGTGDNLNLFVQSNNTIFSIKKGNSAIDTIASAAKVFQIDNNANTVYLFPKDSTIQLKNISSKEIKQIISINENIKGVSEKFLDDELIIFSKRNIYSMNESGDIQLISKESNTIRDINTFEKEEKVYVGVLLKDQILIRNKNGIVVQKLILDDNVSKIFSNKKGDFIIGIHRAKIQIWKLHF